MIQDEGALIGGANRSSAGRLTVVCQDVPYPPNHGGKLDLWNLIRGLHAQGLSIQLVCWFRRERITPNVRRELMTVADDIVEVPRRKQWWRLLSSRYPPRMLSFSPARRDHAELRRRVETFAPDWLLLDSWAGYLPASALAREIGRPLVYRSQNVEHRYYRELRRVARGTMKITLALKALRLFSAEREIRRTVDLVADISADDTSEWDRLGGAGHALVVPPIWLGRAAEAGTERDIDLLFVGNLHTPNNVEGLRWFTSEVLPILHRRMAPRALRVVFAGSEPDAAGLALWRKAGIVCAPNPADVSVFYSRARVVINPLRQGSGVNIKTIEALASGRPVVTTPAAIRGLPEQVRSHFSVCSTPEAFASAAVDILTAEDGPVDQAERAAFVEQSFGPATLRPLILALHQLRPAAIRQHAGTSIPADQS